MAHLLAAGAGEEGTEAAAELEEYVLQVVRSILVVSVHKLHIQEKTMGCW